MKPIRIEWSDSTNSSANGFDWTGFDVPSPVGCYDLRDGKPPPAERQAGAVWWKKVNRARRRTALKKHHKKVMKIIAAAKKKGVPCPSLPKRPPLPRP